MSWKSGWSLSSRPPGAPDAGGVAAPGASADVGCNASLGRAACAGPLDVTVMSSVKLESMEWRSRHTKRDP